MIKNIELTGFKSFVGDDIDLGNLTLLTGLNSSGKSSVIQAILLLEKASKGNAIFLEGHGNIMECKNPYNQSINIKAQFSEGGVLEITDNTSISSGTINFPEIIHISADRFGPETSIAINSISNKLGRKGENIFKCIEHYSDIPIPEILRHPKSQGLTFLFNLKAWLGVISPNVKFEPHIQEMSDSSYSTFNGYRAKNVGFGLSYSLAVITALLLGSITQNSLVIIENPEAHLHPRGQTEMARLIGLCVQSGVNVIVETHSDHLFDGIRIFTKQSSNKFNDKCKLYWFELDSENNTAVEKITIDENGRVQNWPTGMFDQFEVNASKLL
jgi:predicted ATPase